MDLRVIPWHWKGNIKTFYLHLICAGSPAELFFLFDLLHQLGYILVVRCVNRLEIFFYFELTTLWKLVWFLHVIKKLSQVLILSLTEYLQITSEETIIFILKDSWEEITYLGGLSFTLLLEFEPCGLNDMLFPSKSTQITQTV